jgi:hypothetical protein
VIVAHMGEELLPLLAGSVGVVPALYIVARTRLGAMRKLRRSGGRRHVEPE